MWKSILFEIAIKYGHEALLLLWNLESVLGSFFQTSCDFINFDELNQIKKGWFWNIQFVEL